MQPQKLCHSSNPSPTHLFAIRGGRKRERLFFEDFSGEKVGHSLKIFRYVHFLCNSIFAPYISLGSDNITMNTNKKTRDYLYV